jgi:kanamycin kinase
MTTVLSGRPSQSLEVPVTLARLIDGRAYEFIWLNELGGLTARVTDGQSAIYIKWDPRPDSNDAHEEVQRLIWAEQFVRVPHVLDFGIDEGGSWITTSALEGENAVSTRWSSDPRIATTAVGKGLRALHDALDVAACPFSWSLDDRRELVERRFSSGELDGREFSHEIKNVSLEEAMKTIRSAPAEDLVVCHGDACAPNTLLDERGEWTAHVDMGQLGVGDRWADLAVASWSAVWNYGPQWERNVIDAYGIEPDHEKIRLYRLLWELQ